MGEKVISGASLVNIMRTATAVDKIPTGLKTLDSVLAGGIEPGIYVLGAVASLGKTTLALQLAADIAKGGWPVMYFAFEQAKEVLLAKILSRETWLNNSDAGYSADEILRDNGCLDEVLGMIDGKFLNYLAFNSDPSEMAVSAIADAISEYSTVMQRRPVVFLDYLQLLSAFGSSQSDKSNVDSVILSLCQYVRKNKIPMFLISSLNRANYSTATTMAAFKETGLIEYSADVLMTLEFENARTKSFSFYEEISKENRSMMLRILKNKMGSAGESVRLTYEPKYNVFYEKATGLGKSQRKI